MLHRADDYTEQTFLPSLTFAQIALIHAVLGQITRDDASKFIIRNVQYWESEFGVGRAAIIERLALDYLGSGDGLYKTWEAMEPALNGLPESAIPSLDPGSYTVQDIHGDKHQLLVSKDRKAVFLYHDGGVSATYDLAVDSTLWDNYTVL